MPGQTNQVYQSFLVRCWLIPAATGDEPSVWRFEVQEVAADSQKHRFSELEQLTTFMSAQLMAVAAEIDQDGDKDTSK